MEYVSFINISDIFNWEKKIKIIRGTTRPNFEEYNSEIEIK